MSTVAPIPWPALLVAGLCVFGSAQAASPMRFDRIGPDAGLPEQAINAIAQDPTGFLWVGTEDGLDRYDGLRFEHFTHERMKKGTLPSNFVADIRFDASGLQWVATYDGGVVQRTPRSGEFSPLPYSHTGAAADGLERVRVLFTDRGARLWIGTRDSGLAVFDPSSSQLRRFRHSDDSPPSLVDDSIFAILEDRRGHMWIGSEAGVDLLDRRTSQIKHHPLVDQTAVPTRRIQVNALLEDVHGLIWIGSEAGLERYDPVTGATTRFPGKANDIRSLPLGSIEALYQDREQRLWIGTTDGLARFDSENGTFETYRNDPRDAESLPDNHVVSLFEDRSGLLWVGTKFGGLAKWNPRSWSFGPNQADAEQGFASHNINAFTEDLRGRLWVGTYGGGLTVIGSGGKRTVTLRAEGLQGGLTDDRIMALITDRAGNIWAGTMGHGLERIAADSLAVTHYRHDPADSGSIGAAGVMSLLEDSKGRIWAGTFGGGLSRLDVGATAFQTYRPDPNDPTRLSSDRITALAEDGHGRIWAGTDGGGLDILDPDTGDLIRLRHDFKDRRSLSSDTVYSLYVDPKGIVWIGTRGGGLDHIQSRTIDSRMELTNLSEADGLPNNTVYGIVPDTAGRLWLSTNRGLACLDRRTGTLNSYHRSHGLRADEFNFGAHYRARDGRLLFGGANGYNEFYPERLQFDRTLPPVALTNVLLMGRPLRADTVYDGSQNLHFGYRDDVITFEYAALDFTVPAANAFEYRLAGFDREWIRAGTRHSATYTHLPGGNYHLQVRAANADGLWNPAGLSVPISVDPPPWKTTWAYLCYAILGAVFGYLLWLRQRRALEQAANYRRQLEQEVLTRTRELAERNSALQRANTLLETVSFTDALTGLGNRRMLDHAMPTLIATLKRSGHQAVAENSRLAVLLVDLDRLKPINDQHGHEAGDRLIIEVAEILKECVRGSAQIVRWGGDEFVVVHAVNALDDAVALAERLRFSVSKRRFKIGKSVAGRTSCSIGFALYPFVPGAFPHLGWEKIMAVADANLYRAKATRNAWVGCCGARVGIPDIETLAERDLDAAERKGYVDVRRSASAGDETVELLLRSPAQARPQKGE
ncbi:MAG TPA: two-component regulator propeller domain-containing protein [Steroidobacteraceae bacterium]|nr:two-component regulator propeller domain-containing protein [Steroidobacteraceae bacterium]